MFYRNLNEQSKRASHSFEWPHSRESPYGNIALLFLIPIHSFQTHMSEETVQYLRNVMMHLLIRDGTVMWSRGQNWFCLFL